MINRANENLPTNYIVAHGEGNTKGENDAHIHVKLGPL